MTAEDPIAAAIRAQPPLRDVIATAGLTAKKGLGQHFLLDLNVTDRIVRLAGDLAAGTTVEIGPGPGGLTRSLLMAGAQRLVAVERDDRAIAALAPVAEAAAGRLTLLPADAMQIRLEDLGPAPRRIVANLPYNIGTELLLGWLQRPQDWERLVLMFQKEVAERVVATQSSDAYGRLAVLVATVCAEARLALTLPARAFTPPPKVDSAVVTLTPRPQPLAPLDALERVTRAAFGQRRKMLRSSLKGLKPDLETWLGNAGLEPTWRAEEVTPAGFQELARTL